VRSSQPRTQLGWGGIGLPTLVFVVMLAAGCGDGGETAESADPGSATSAGPEVIPTTAVASTTVTTSSPTEAPVAGPAPRFFTPATPSGAYRMAVGESSTIQLPDDAPAPEVRGGAALVIDVASVAPAGFRQWELRGVAAGEATISIGGDRPALWLLIVVG